ncbi:MAG: hypothetical protein A3B23_02720 [Candidatus Colwellbacteria bacterium RIFCSPLOWO2_01_FULL_48_10]|uniref:Uncharacterized protein n=1 Tax=Candidatus Colwellbacteria bacterium RIFCSPLOWO2_01_FULL_48_10 TaxID=1797690 RepID=A0A1G1Z3K2_9BACT|nr:MAG: hypothetical protein A3B23_02720 [Candidatus Colwellbacteria bacterium RIFCSPLOWO2_01_FULL_48_10]
MAIYTALFVKDIGSLLKSFPPKHSRHFGHHSTIAFNPPTIDGIEIGREGKLKIIGQAYDSKGDALLVESPRSKNAYPHITLSCSPDTKPVYSNEMIEKAVLEKTVEYFAEPIWIDVVEGYSDGKQYFTTPARPQ